MLRFTLFALFMASTQAKGLTKYPYNNYNFDYSSHNIPIAYTSVDNTVELFSKVKLNSKVPSKGGAYILDAPLDQTVFEEFEVDVEFTLNTDPAQARGFMILFNRNEPKVKDFQSSQLGYKHDYEGVGVYVFRHLS